MAIRRASLGAVSLLPIGGPAGAPGQPGKDGVTPDVSGLLPKTGDASSTTVTLPGGVSQSLPTAIAPVVALGIARADIPTRIIPLISFRVSGFAAAGDYGAGASYIRGTPLGPMAISDAAGTWFQLDLGAPVMFAGWFGVVPGVLTAAQGAANRIGLTLAARYLTTGRTLYLAGKIALAPDPSNINAPAWNLADGTTTSIATTAGWSVLSAGGCATPGAGELGGSGGTELVAVGTWGTGPMVRLNGPIIGVDLRISVNCAGLAAVGVDLIHAFRCRFEIEAQRYTVNGIVCRTINGPLFSGITQGFMECKQSRLTATQPATRTAEGVVLRAYEATVAKGSAGYFYQGFSRNQFTIKSEIPGAAGCAAVVIDRIDNNDLPMMFTFVGGNGADAGSGGVRGIASQDGFFPCENVFSAGHILGGWIGNWGTGGNRAPAYSTSDGETFPPLTFVWDTHTGLFGGARRIYADDSGSLGQPSFTFQSAQDTGLSRVVGGGAALSAGGVLGLQWDTAGRVGAGMPPVAGYALSINGGIGLNGGSNTIEFRSGSYGQIQAATTLFWTTAGQQQVTVDANGIYPSTTNRNCGLSNSQWLNVFSVSGTFSGPVKVGTYTVSTLPTAGVAGRLAWATNGRALQSGGALEASGSGTGCLVTDNGSAWRVAGTTITVSA